jgi:signal transduction histidine kinase
VARIVLIDDEEALREAFAEILSGAGHETVLAATGLEGLEAVRRARPDLVICDVNMPGLDGYGVLEALRGDPLLSSIPFLFLTGLDAPDRVRMGMNLGADDYVVKPVASQELLAAVAARLARREAGQREARRQVDDMRRGVAMLLPHELRTPLTTIIGCAEALREFHQTMSGPAIEEMAEAIAKGAQRLHRLTENYLLYAGLELERLAHSGTSTRPLTGDCGAADVRAPALAQAAERGREQDLRLELGEVAVPVAAPYLRKIVSELLDNALKFSAAGSEVRVALGGTGSAVVLEVADSGRGMTPEQIAEVGAFRQFDRALFEQQGSGLGLVLVRAMIEASGGQLELASPPAGGTRARARWPAQA